jgi:hypothetical protein
MAEQYNQQQQVNGPVKSRYSVLKSCRDPYLMRARECALFTIPMLVPPEGANNATKYPTPYQSLGARGVNNLAAKLLLTLLPPNSPFFRLSVDDFTLEKLAQREGARAEVEEALNRIERAVMQEIETTPTRAPAFEALKLLLVSGNVLLFMQPEGGLKVFRLDQYTVKRDPSGNLLEVVTCELVSPMEIPEKVRPIVLGDTPKPANATDDSVEIYTHILRTNTGWEISQEINGKTVPGSYGTYPLDKSPWLALRFIAMSGEDYGRGYVEEYLGDLKSLEGLSKAIVQASAAAAKVLFLVKPNSTTMVKDLTNKESGEFAQGNKDDITVLQMEKYADFRVALDMRKNLVDSLSFAFLLNTAVQRDGERVTAEEIRYMANELEAALGGVYSTMSQELQLPFVTRLMHTMEQAKRLPTLPKGIVRPMITTGIEAIGRGHDLTKLAGLLQDLNPLGPEAISMWLDVGDFIKRCATARGIDQKGLVRKREEVEQSQQQGMIQNLIAKLGPNAINQIGGMARDRMAAGEQPTKGAQ